MLAMLPMALGNTFVAYVLWCWAGLISLNSFLYGFMRDLPYVQIFAMVALALVLTRKDKESTKFKSSLTTTLFMVFCAHALLVAIFAYEGLPRNWEMFLNILKTIVFLMLMPVLVTSRLRIHALVVIIVLGLGFHGVLDGLKFLASGGGHRAVGIAKFGDNNYQAMALAVTLPLLFYMASYAKIKWVKWGVGGSSFLLVLAIMATGSRGGLITLVVLALWLFWYGKNKFQWSIMIALFAGLMVALAPESWTERMSTIKEAQEDSSFMVRVAVWKKSTAIALAHPLVGAGFYGAQAPPLGDKYRNAQGLMGFIDTPDPQSFAAHSIYFQVMGDMGFVGFFIYMALLLNTFYTRGQIRRLAQAQGASAKWADDLANMLAASMTAFMVGGALLSAAYFEIPFLVMGLMGVTKQVLEKMSVQLEEIP